MKSETIVIERELKPLVKQCARCKETKELPLFPMRNNKHIGVCRSCYSEHYGDPDKLDEKRKAANRRHSKVRINKAKSVVAELLVNGCVDCGEMDPIVLEFDHRNPSEKEADISKLMHGGRIHKLKEELHKCDVVCANCHRRRTAKTFGSWRD